MCPKCATASIKQECTVFSRIVGYLRPVDQWNSGKQEEYSERKIFDKGGIEKGEKSKHVRLKDMPEIERVELK